MKKSKLDYEDRQFIAYNLLSVGYSPQVGKNKLGFIVAGFGDVDPETGEFLYPLTVVNGKVAPRVVLDACRDLEEKLTEAKKKAASKATSGASARGMARTHAHVDSLPYISNHINYRDGHIVMGNAVEMASDSPFGEITDRILSRDINAAVRHSTEMAFPENRADDNTRQSRGSESVSCSVSESYSSRSSSASYSDSSSSSDSGSSSSCD